MQLVTIESRTIHAVGYGKEKHLLEIIFNNGGIYQYVNVPPEIYEGLLNAESKGHYFAENIRNVYQWWELKDAPK